MSDAVLPSFPGLAWNVARSPVFHTIIKPSVSGREFRAAQYVSPRWKYKLSYEVLRARSALLEMQQLAAFFNACAGSYDTFLYLDPDDKTATAAVFGTGDNSTTAFQLLRPFGGFTEPVYALLGSPSIYKNGVLQASGYTISSTGVVTFATAPATGVTLTWTGTFYWRCRFVQDQLEFNQFMKNFWDLRALEFITVKP